MSISTRRLTRTAVCAALALTALAPTAAPAAAPNQAERALQRLAGQHGTLQMPTATKTRQAQRRMRNLAKPAGATKHTNKKQMRANNCVIFYDGAVCAWYSGYASGNDALLYIEVYDAYGYFAGNGYIWNSTWITWRYSMGL